MGRKKKLVNNTDIPQYAIERVARCVLDDIREDYLKEEVLKAFAEWEREWRSYTIKRGLQEKKERAASTAALSVLFRPLFSSRPTGFRFGTYLPAVAEVGVFVTGEINK